MTGVPGGLPGAGGPGGPNEGRASTTGVAPCEGRAARHWSLCGAVPRTREGVSLSRASLVAQTGKNLPVMRETWVQSLSQDPLEQEMATHSSIRAQRIPWTEEPGRLQSWGCKESDTTGTLAHPYHWQWGPQALPFSWALSVEPSLWKGSYGHRPTSTLVRPLRLLDSVLLTGDSSDGVVGKLFWGQTPCVCSLLLHWCALGRIPKVLVP